MTRSILYVAGAASALALVLASACTVEEVDDDSTSSSGGSTTSQGGSTTSQGGSTTSTGGTTSQGGSGGGGTCIGCSEYVTDPNATADQLCGFVPPDSCEVGTSCELAALLSVCVCGDGTNAGMCETECEFTCTGMGMDAEMGGCQTCAQASCAGEFNDCIADT